jgi:hypothetical protein
VRLHISGSFQWEEIISGQNVAAHGELVYQWLGGGFTTMYVLIGAMRTMRGVRLSKMGMHAFQMFGGSYRLTRRYCNASIVITDDYRPA